MNRIIATVLSAALVSAVFPSAAVATAVQAGAANQTANAPAAAVGDAQIRSFALALVEIGKVRKWYAAEVQSVSKDKKAQIDKEADAKLAAAVRAQGMDPQSFMTIGASIEKSPELKAKLKAELDKLVVAQAPTGR